MKLFNRDADDKPTPLSELEGVNDAQKKILALCYTEPRGTTYLMKKLNLDSGYIWKLCERLVGLDYLKKHAPVRKVVYKTNRDQVDI